MYTTLNGNYHSTTERHLPYGITVTQCCLPPNTSEHASP